VTSLNQDLGPSFFQDNGFHRFVLAVPASVAGQLHNLTAMPGKICRMALVVLRRLRRTDPIPEPLAASTALPSFPIEYLNAQTTLHGLRHKKLKEYPQNETKS
jgi:hypothetical protein